jgi:predicted small integral membrane protein
MVFGDKLFWGIMLFIGINLFWLGVLEDHIPLWLAPIVGVIGTLSVIKFVPPPKSEGSQDEE